jgi:hypothetical protein
MDTERTDGLLDEAVVPSQAESEGWSAAQMSGPPTPPSTPAGRGCGLHMLRFAVGAAIAFVVMSLLYGPNMAMMAIAFAVICTAGISLILIIPGCWLIGWVAIAAWQAISRRSAKPTAPGAP